MEGKAIVYDRDNINTDEIIPARYLNTSDPDQLASHCMEDLDKDFLKNKNALGAEIMITGSNMGCGSSREHAPIAIKHAGIKAVVAPSYARIFFRNAINTGLAIFECTDPAFYKSVKAGDFLKVDADGGRIENVSSGKVFSIQKMPPFLQDLIRVGGLVSYAKRLALEVKEKKEA
ncbi:MAG: 3-isopropylmalate dehydratase small subunit [Candidatus Lokiarchaeota archaeon]|nr:3-isopropylmalate dehydratase small subunit [Candidatus Lokiarchaeota archaeon]